MYRKFGKRVFDIAASLLCLLLFWPLLLAVAILVRLKLGAPVLFAQMRPGREERLFCLFKFRTMTDDRDEHGKLLPDERRLPSFGRMLRRTSLDELPELFNILRGDMSFVGPRPQLVRDNVFFTSEQRKRQSVPPGLTGLAQISGRNGISWEAKLEYDLQYIRHITFWGDCKILWRTVSGVFNGSGVSADGMATAEDFGDYLLRERKITPEEYEQGLEKSRELLRR